jgi:hypothetical protein
MTFKDLQKIIVQKEIITPYSSQLERLRNKPFWIWNREEHIKEDIETKGECCFNHIIGLPKKENIVEKPLFDYEQIIFDILQQNKHIWIKKATGLGITEFFLRYMTWLCLRDDQYQNSQMCIVTGPNIEIAIKLIKRMKALFENKFNIIFSNKETVLELNKCRIEAYPSNHLDSYRALDNPKFILLDEADFFRKGEQEDVRHVSERYIAKSNPYIVMVSTSNAPDGLFEKIEKEPEETCLYRRIKLDYTDGLDKIYSLEEIEKAKQSPSFEREYNLKYLGLIGNVFHEKDIQNALKMGKTYDPYDLSNKDFDSSSMGIDCGFGSSAFGIVITRYANEKEKVQILYAEEFDRPDFNEMLSRVGNLIFEYNPTKIYIDGANPAFIKSLKIQLGDKGIEQREYERLVEYSKKYNKPIDEYMRVIPVSFNKEHKNMLAHCKLMLEKDYVEINPKFDKLVTALRTAVENGEGNLDKEQTSYDDIFDAYRLALKYYQIHSQK